MNEEKNRVETPLADWAEAVKDCQTETQDIDDLTTAVESIALKKEEKRSTAALKEPDSRPHLNIVFIGHVDAGKSTTCGNILYSSGLVDQRTMEKYEREAKEKNRESWFLAFIMDTNEEERQKGKTVEVGRAQFELPKRRFTILDAPGHKSFVPNMISGASQADVGVLIISARKGEFETGFERGGQTREHALLAKTLGVNQLIVAVNKMDDPTCNWNQERYLDIEKKLSPFLKTCGYNPARDIFFVPISGQIGQNLKYHVGDESNLKTFCPNASWYTRDKPTLFDLLDNLSPPERSIDAPLRVPLLDGYKDSGVICIGKVEAGLVKVGEALTLMPNMVKVKVTGICLGEETDDYAFAGPGENVRVKLSGIEEDSISKGFVLCGLTNYCPVVIGFKAQIMIVELLEHRPIITTGYQCVLHAHTACEEVTIDKLLEATDMVTKKKKISPPWVKSQYMVVAQMVLSNPLCLESFSSCAQMGRFTLRDEGKTIAIGKILEITNTI